MLRWVKDTIWFSSVSDLFLLLANQCGCGAGCQNGQCECKDDCSCKCDCKSCSRMYFLNEQYSSFIFHFLPHRWKYKLWCIMYLSKLQLFRLQMLIIQTSFLFSSFSLCTLHSINVRTLPWISAQYISFSFFSRCRRMMLFLPSQYVSTPIWHVEVEDDHSPAPSIAVIDMFRTQ